MLPEGFDAGLDELARDTYQRTGRNVTWVLGGIGIRTEAGGSTTVRGVYTADGFIVQADHLRVSAEQLLRHEEFHDRAARTPGMAQQAVRNILETVDRESFKQMVDAYMRVYGPLYGSGKNMTKWEAQQVYNAVVEEVLADAYAGINAFGTQAAQYTQPVTKAAQAREPVDLVELLRGDVKQMFSAGTDPETTSIKEQLAANAEYLNTLPLAVSLTVPSNLKGKKAAVRWAVEQLKPTGYRVEKQGYGTIYFNPDDINKGMEYADTPAEKAAIAALPYVLKRGVEIGHHDQHKGRTKRTVTFAAPVELNGVRGNMAVVVNRHGDRYNTHRIVLPDGTTFKFSEQNNDAAQEPSRGVTVTGSLAKTTSAASNETIAQEAKKSNPQKYSADDAEAERIRRRDELTDRAFNFRRVTPLSEDTGPVHGQSSLDGGQGLSGKSPAVQSALGTSGSALTRADSPSGLSPATRAAKKKARPVAESKPIIAKRDLRKNMLSLFSIPDGRRAELGDMVERFADRLLERGKLTEADRSAFFERMYAEGVMEIPADQYLALGRETLRGNRIYVDEKTRGEFFDNWGDFRRRAFANGVYLTSDPNDSGIDAINMELAEALPGLFDADDLDNRSILERIIQVAEEGRSEKLSLREYAQRMAGYEFESEDELQEGMVRQMDWMLRTFAEKAELEIKLRDRTGVKIAQEREHFQAIQQRQRDSRALRELQQKTLKQLQWLSKNRNKAPAELKARFDEVLGDLDIYAASTANEMHWDKRYNATWRDLADMYKQARETDPNFMPSKELQKIVDRLDKDKIGDMDVGALQDLYRAAVGIRTEFYNRNNLINDEQRRMFAEVFTDATGEIRDAAGGYKTGAAGAADRFASWEQLTPMNALERMSGWKKDGAWTSMARQLEAGERKVRDYTVRAKRALEGFIAENADWLKTADGQGKDGVWYELAVPELLELGKGDKPIFGETVTVSMTPLQKVQLYLESKNTDNLRHMAGGRTFADRALYAKGERQEAMRQGTVVRLAPETVKKIVSELTPQEQALAGVLEQY